VALSSRLDRDLGIDSLGRTELILRIERAFGVRLPIDAMAEAETVGDVLRALEQGLPRHGTAQIPEPARPLATVPPASEAATLTQALDWHAATHRDRVHLSLLRDDAEPDRLTYGDLADAARRAAAGLIARDIMPGDRIALMLPTSLDFFVTFFGVLFAGGVPVPIYPPTRMSQIEDHLRRQAGILRNAGASMLVTVPEGLRVGRLLRAQVETLRAVESPAALRLDGAEFPAPKIDASATALIQYTSGSTGDPKGVVLSHANLLANIRAMGAAMEASSRDVFVSWLPLYHDMGLIGAWLGCLYFGAPLYVMSPLSFLARPQSWLWAIDRCRATLSAAPNFAFELCLDKIDDAELQGLDLSSLRMVANGAEPVSVHTLRRFIDRFGRYGFRREAMAPVYGLAEDAVGLAFPPVGRGPIVDRVDREALSRDGVAKPAGPDDPKPLEVVACGRPLAGHEIRIVDEAGREVGERREGRLEFRGPSATSGYFRNEAKTKALFHEGWLDSGDRAYMANGDVFITGRIKDIIIRGGRHIYPQEVEEAIGEIPRIRKGGVAVFGVTDPALGTEQLIAVAETRVTDAAAREALRASVREVAADRFGVAPDAIVLAPPRSVPKTSSGKVRRSAAKALYETGRLRAPPRAPVWRQMLRLQLAGAGPTLRRSGRLLADHLYAGWWWTALATGFLVGWVAVMILPRLDWRWRAVRAVARTALAAMGVPVSVVGGERLAAANAMLVFNHSSYADALVLAAVLPGEPIFVVKKELAAQFVAGTALPRLGALFVERYDVLASLADAETVTSAARRGGVLVSFPEGGFTRQPGLCAFHLGAFKTAAETGLAVIPGAIRGTRSMLRSDQWFPRCAAIHVEIAEPIQPGGQDFPSVLRLRDAARAAVLARCGEPDVG
ncbi:MAG TPA: AMP-binding protein, partial [Roseiarcus sp.]|nr:AMP-binding protein [Roseiarcus sp.]